MLATTLEQVKALKVAEAQMAGSTAGTIATGTMFAGGRIDPMKSYRQRMAKQLNERSARWEQMSKGVRSSWDSGSPNDPILNELRKITKNTTRPDVPVAA